MIKTVLRYYLKNTDVCFAMNNNKAFHCTAASVVTDCCHWRDGTGAGVGSIGKSTQQDTRHIWTAIWMDGLCNSSIKFETRWPF